MQLLPMCVHLWLVKESMITSSSLQMYSEMLSHEELERSRRFHFSRDRDSYIIRRATVRSVLSLYEKRIAPTEWKFATNYYGKPRIANPLNQPLIFNLSSSKGVIVLALAREEFMGVDIEYSKGDLDVVQVSRNTFAREEVEELLMMKPSLRLRRFYDIWTLKEAYVKALSCGLSMPLDQFAFNFLPDSTINLELPGKDVHEAKYWRFWQLSPVPDYRLSIAIKAADSSIGYSLSTREVVPLVSSRKIDVSFEMSSRYAA